MIKDIIEKTLIFKNEVKESNLLSQTFKNGYNEACRDILPDLEKSAEQETALIKALVFCISLECNVCKMCRQYNDKCKPECTYEKYRKLLESITGKKWEEIKEVYR